MALEDRLKLSRGLRLLKHTCLLANTLLSSLIDLVPSWISGYIRRCPTSTEHLEEAERKLLSQIWYQVFLWALFSSLFVHFVAAIVAFSMLRKQQMGRFSPLLILLMGLMAPLTGGALTSAVIAGVYRAARFHMMPFYALVWGCGQTVFAVVMSYTRVLATL